MATKIAVVGLGKIAQDQHLPALSASVDWELAATVSRSITVPGVDNYATLEELIDERPDITVISLCVPPAPRFDMAVATINAGRHLMLEKPPGATLTECVVLDEMAKAKGVSLYTTWHSREAHKVDLAKEWLADKAINSFEIVWREDVRRWHPGQDWIFEPAGMGVFDPGINALSILTKILPEPVRVTKANLLFPENRQTPISVDMNMLTLSGGMGHVDFDFRQEGEQIWEMSVVTSTGTLALKKGGAELFIDGVTAGTDSSDDFTLDGEYPRLYAAMHDLVAQSKSDVDLRPHQLVADALMLGSRSVVEPFEF